MNIKLTATVVEWLIPCDFRFRGSIKDAVSLKLETGDRIRSRDRRALKDVGQ